jgi:hypothetical protein
VPLIFLEQLGVIYIVVFPRTEKLIKYV